MANYEQAIDTVERIKGKSETELLRDFISQHEDNPKYQWDEWAMNALESEQFADWVVQYAWQCELDDWLEEYYKD